MRLKGKFSLLADRDKAGLQFHRGSRGKDETACVNADHSIHHSGFDSVAKQINTSTEQPGIGQERGNVFELNSGLRKIRNVADRAFDLGSGDLHWGFRLDLSLRGV